MHRDVSVPINMREREREREQERGNDEHKRESHVTVTMCLLCKSPAIVLSFLVVAKGGMLINF